MDAGMMSLALIASSMVGAYSDWKYKKAGGRRLSKQDRSLFGALCLIVAGAIAVVEFTGLDPRGLLGYVVVPLAIVLFGAWELGRWRIRRKYPLQALPSDTTP
jgi:hypothetical protein